jgi:hypothetical protein
LETNRRQSSQYITMSAPEWAAYTIWSDAPKEYSLTMKAKSADTPTDIQIVVGDRVRQVTISGTNWSEIKLGTIALAQGTNHLKWCVKSGVADLDWIELGPAEKNSHQ